MLNKTLLKEAQRQAAVISASGSRSLSSQSPPISNSLEANPYYAKYAEKLKEAQKKSTSPSAPKSIDAITQEEAAIIQCLKKFELKYDTDNADPGPRAAGGKRKSLNDIVKMDLLKEQSSEEIWRIWSEYHSKKDDCIYSVLKSQEYDMITNLTMDYPVFLYPIPRDDSSRKESMGYQFFIGQFANNSCYFTPLVYYQRYQDLAPISLVVNYYPELKSEKGIVLMNGEFDNKVINLLEVRCLANQFKLYYEGPDEKKRQLLHEFNKNPGSFNHLDVITEFEVLGGR